MARHACRDEWDLSQARDRGNDWIPEQDIYSFLTRPYTRVVAYTVVENNPGPKLSTQRSLSDDSVLAKCAQTGFWLTLKCGQCTRMTMKWTLLRLLVITSIRSVLSKFQGSHRKATCPHASSFRGNTRLMRSGVASTRVTCMQCPCGQCRRPSEGV